MCGIVGYKLTPGASRCEKTGFLIEQLLVESQIRGRHAAGICWLDKDGNLQLLKRALAAREFVNISEWRNLMADPPDLAIAQTRYSTSGDWHEVANNQPLLERGLGLVHNGIVAMAAKGGTEERFGTQLVTENDSEVLLRKILGHHLRGASDESAIHSALEDIQRIEKPIFACGLLTSAGSLYAFRDDVRPLWLFSCPELGLQGFASTRQIVETAAFRAGITKLQVFQAVPGIVYDLNESSDSLSQHPGGGQAGDTPVLRPVTQVSGHSAHKAGCGAASFELDKDFRLMENRREGFVKYYAAQLATDIDPAFPMMKAIFERYELSQEQRYYMAFLYAAFYHCASMFLFIQEFPDFEKIDIRRLREWHSRNWRLLQYQKDRRWNKGHLVEQIESYRQLVGSETQHEFFSRLVVENDPTQTFRNVWDQLIKVHKMGRHSVYAWTETLIRCLNFPMECDDFFMAEAESSRNGLCYALGRDDLLTKHDKKVGDGSRISSQDILYLESELGALMEDIRFRYPGVPVDFMYVETCACAYKGLHQGRRYLGYYLDRMAAEIRSGEIEMAEMSRGVDWDVLWEIRKEIFIPEYLGELQPEPWYAIRKELCSEFSRTGRLVNIGPLIRRGLLNATGKPVVSDVDSGGRVPEVFVA